MLGHYILPAKSCIPNFASNVADDICILNLTKYCTATWKHNLASSFPQPVQDLGGSKKSCFCDASQAWIFLTVIYDVKWPCEARIADARFFLLPRILQTRSCIVDLADGWEHRRISKILQFAAHLAEGLMGTQLPPQNSRKMTHLSEYVHVDRELSRAPPGWSTNRQREHRQQENEWSRPKTFKDKMARSLSMGKKILKPMETCPGTPQTGNLFFFWGGVSHPGVTTVTGNATHGSMNK